MDLENQPNVTELISTGWANFGWFGTLAIYVGIVVSVSLCLHYVIVQWQKRLREQGHLRRSLSLVGKFFVPLQVFLICFPLLFMLPKSGIPADARDVLRVIGKIGSAISLIVLSSRLVGVFASLYYQQLKIDQVDNLKGRRLKTQVQFLEQIADLVIIFLGLSALLLSFEKFRSFGGSLLASAGLASVIIGFAAQKSIGNLIAGFQIAFTQPIRFGDAIFVEGEWGVVEEITLTYVVVRIWDLRRLVLPINYFLEKPFQNWTRTSASLIGQVTLFADYSLPLDELRAELARILKDTPLWDGTVSALQVVETTERSMQIRVLVSARDSGATFELRCLVREQLIMFMQKHHPESLPKVRFDVDSLDRLSEITSRVVGEQMSDRKSGGSSRHIPVVEQ